MSFDMNRWIELVDRRRTQPGGLTRGELAELLEALPQVVKRIRELSTESGSVQAFRVYLGKSNTEGKTADEVIFMACESYVSMIEDWMQLRAELEVQRQRIRDLEEIEKATQQAMFYRECNTCGRDQGCHVCGIGEIRRQLTGIAAVNAAIAMGEWANRMHEEHMMPLITVRATDETWAKERDVLLGSLEPVGAYGLCWKYIYPVGGGRVRCTLKRDHEGGCKL